jgi:hypothetical protein
MADSKNALEGGTKFRFPIIGSGFGPGGKFLGRMLAQVYGARAMIRAAMLAAMRETSNAPMYVVHGNSGGKAMITNAAIASQCCRRKTVARLAAADAVS